MRSEFCAYAWPPGEGSATVVGLNVVVCDAAAGTAVRATLELSLVPIDEGADRLRRVSRGPDKQPGSNKQPFANAVFATQSSGESDAAAGLRAHVCGRDSPGPRAMRPFVRASLSGVPVGRFSLRLRSIRRVRPGEAAPERRVRGVMAAEQRAVECAAIDAELAGPASAIGGITVSGGSSPSPAVTERARGAQDAAPRPDGGLRSTGECRGAADSMQRLCHVRNVCFQHNRVLLFDASTVPQVYPNSSFAAGTGIGAWRWHPSSLAVMTNVSARTALTAAARWINGTTLLQMGGAPAYFEFHSLADLVGGVFMGREVARCAFPALLDGEGAVGNVFLIQEADQSVAKSPQCGVFDAVLRAFVDGGELLYSENLQGDEAVCFERAVIGANMWLGLWSPFYNQHGFAAGAAAADMLADYGRRLRRAFGVPEPELPWVRRYRASACMRGSRSAGPCSHAYTRAPCRSSPTMLQKWSRADCGAGSGASPTPMELVSCRRVLTIARPERNISNVPELSSALRTASRGTDARARCALLFCVRLEDVPFAEQLQMFAETDVLLAPHTGALANALLLPRHAAVLEVEPYGFRKAQFSYNAIGRLVCNLGLRYARYRKCSFSGTQLFSAFLPTNVSDLFPGQSRDDVAAMGVAAYDRVTALHAAGALPGPAYWRYRPWLLSVATRLPPEWLLEQLWREAEPTECTGQAVFHANCTDGG
jgi:hypothetical protein